MIGNMLKPSYIKRAQQMAEILNDVTSIFVVAKGICLPIAKEGALKLKETTYIHAEALSAGDLKHGPIALIDFSKPKSTRSKTDNLTTFSHPPDHGRQKAQ